MGPIFLYGPPGTGKSTIGKLLANVLRLPFIDLDLVIETNAGTSISQIMEGQGESVFRDLETVALKNHVNGKESVIALGGGALLRNENRSMAENSGNVLLLMAEPQTLIERLQIESNRPLLAGDLTSRLTALLEKRREHYNSFPVVIHVDGEPAEQSTYHAQIVLGRHHLSAMGEYDVVVQSNGIEKLGKMFKARGLQNPIVVTDENVAKLHLEKAMTSLRASGFEPNVSIVPAGEEHKNLNTVTRLWESFLENDLDRKSTVIALGGGVIGDMAGFAASTFMRGAGWVAVPTTLLSMVDASLGGKTGFDLPQGKNMIGSFFPPKLVLADPRFLETLPGRELCSGMAEVVKHGIISDPELFELCARELGWVRANLEAIVKRAMAVKIKVIEEDPYEKGSRAVLNLGHTIGHAVELVSRFELRHGEAVAIGMVVEAKYAEKIGLSNKGLSRVIRNALSGLELPVDIPKELPREEILRAMRVDKKKSAKSIRFALPVEIGNVELVDVSDLESVLE